MNGKTVGNERQQAGVRAFLLPLKVNSGLENVVCLFSQSQVVEIIGPRPVQQIPGSPAFLKGVLLYQDSLLPVIDLDDLCNRQRMNGRRQYRQLMVVRTGAVDPVTGEPLKAVVASAVRVQIAKISGQELTETLVDQEAPVSLRDLGLVRGFFRRHEETVALLDLGPVVQGTVAGSREEGRH